MVLSRSRIGHRFPSGRRWLLYLLATASCACTPAAGSPPSDCAPHAHHPPPIDTSGQPAGIPVVVEHQKLKSFENNGNTLQGVATAGQGARSFEVWRTSVAPGSQTPPHRHETEEIFVFLRGTGRAVIGGESFEFDAPATVIAPAGVQHQFFNTGSVPTDAIVVVGIGSRIYDADGATMQLPWRK